MKDNYFDVIKNHYSSIWHVEPNIYLWEHGPIEKLNFDFRVLEFPPSDNRKRWVYATSCMSNIQDNNPIELHIFSAQKDNKLVELLFAIAYYHKTGTKLNLNHTVNFGRSWQDNSICSFGLISLPYVDGPDLENLFIDNHLLKFYWLIPITASELAYVRKNGIEALEEQFDRNVLDYINPIRQSVV